MRFVHRRPAGLLERDRQRRVLPQMIANTPVSHGPLPVAHLVHIIHAHTRRRGEFKSLRMGGTHFQLPTTQS